MTWHVPAFLQTIKQRWNSYQKVHPCLASGLLCFALLTVIWLITAVIAGLAPFGEQTMCTNDGYAQYMPFLSEFWSLLHGDGNVFYTFHGGLGGNFYLTIAYYLLSPFSFLVLLFGKAQIPIAANLIILLKNCLTGSILAGFLTTQSKKPHVWLSTVCGIVYALSYYFLGYAVNFMWMDSIALLPLVLYALPRLSSRKGRLIYILSLAGMILFNFYMGAILCIFIGLYYVVIEMRWTKKGWQQTCWFAACSLCAALMAGIVLMPVVMGMLADNAGRMSPPEFEIYNNLEYVISRFLPDADIVRITHNRGAINLYMGSLVLFLLVVFALQKTSKPRKKYGWLLLCALYLAATQISWLNYAFHGFYLQRQVPNRFDFIPPFLITLMVYQVLIHLPRTKAWKTAAAALASAGFFVWAVLYTQSEQLWMAFTLPLVILGGWMLVGLKKRNLLAGMMAIESCAGLVMCAPGHLGASYTGMAGYLAAASYGQENRSELRESDIVNAPMLYGMKGISAFNSVINPDTASFLGKLGYAAGENYYRFYGWTPLTAQLFDVQTIIASPGEAISWPYEHLHDAGGHAIWSADHSMGWGIAGLNADADLSDKNRFNNINALFPGAFLSTDISSTLVRDEQRESRSDNLYALNDLKEDEKIVIELDPFAGDNVYLYGNMSGCGTYSVLKNGEEIESNSYEGNIVSLGTVLESDLIEVTFTVEQDRDSTTARVYAAQMDLEQTNAWIDTLEQSSLQNQTVKGNRITGTYDTEQPVNMVFTVPFDEGWQATINEQPVQISAFTSALVQIELPAGHSDIQLTYIPAGWNEGIWMSLAGAGLGALLICLPRRTNKPSLQDEA